MTVSLEQGANDLHIVQLTTLPFCHPIVYNFIKIQIGLTFLVPAYPGCPGKEADKRYLFVGARVRLFAFSVH